MFPFDHIPGKYIFNTQNISKMTFWWKYSDKNISTLDEENENVKSEIQFNKITKDLILR
jgi:hypothetical protein